MHGKTKKAWFLGVILSLLPFVSSCSMDLTRLSGIDLPKTIPFFEPISINYNGEEKLLDVELQRAYTATVDTNLYSMEHCRGNVDIKARVTQDENNSSWYVPLAFIPIWPIMPINETWNYHMTVRIFCDGNLTYKAEFDEFEKVKAFWYGKLRTDLVNKASKAMHQRLLDRLKYELKFNRNSDLNSSLT